jgi:hypothetical protein
VTSSPLIEGGHFVSWTLPSGKAPRAALTAVLLLLSACGGGRRPPAAEDAKPLPPDLTGHTVMVLPAQPGAWSAGAAPTGTAPPPPRAAPAELDQELAYWLAERGPRVQWVGVRELERAVQRSPGFRVALRALPVGDFRRAALRQIGEPLYGELRRLGALVDARLAVVPIASGYVGTVTGTGRVEIALAIIDTVGGEVLWFGVVGGEPVPYDDPRAASSAAQAAARAVLP